MQPMADKPRNLAPNCDHLRWVYPPAAIDERTGETEQPEAFREFTYADLDVGRFYCTQCGEIGYYTGLWRAFHEDGIPCPGSELVQRRDPKLHGRFISVNGHPPSPSMPMRSRET
jgi:hypothetical protein